MKKIVFNLDKSFNLSNVKEDQLFELENNSAELIFNTEVDSELVYELHIDNGTKVFIALDKHDDYVGCIVSNSILKEGYTRIQIRAVGSDEYAIESNVVGFTVKSFINASDVPNPIEPSEREELLVHIEEIANKANTNASNIETLSENVGEFASDLEAEVSNRTASEAEIEQSIEAEKTARVNADTIQVEAITAVNNEISSLTGIVDGISDEIEDLYGKFGDYYTAQQTDNKIDSAIEVKARDISYSNIPTYCGKWVDNRDMYRRVYVLTDNMAKDVSVKVADKPSNMVMLIRGWGISVCENVNNNTMTTSEIVVYVNDNGVFVNNRFTGYATKIYVVLEYTV